MYHTQITGAMKTLTFLFGIGILLSSCNSKELEDRIAQLELEKAEIKTEVRQKDASVTAFMTSLSEIEKNLREIREREMNIALAQREEKLTPKALGEKIKEDIKVINELLQKNRVNISSLNKQLSFTKSENAKVNRLMGQLRAELTQQITEREEEIGQLKEQLLAQEVVMEELHTNFAALHQVSLSQDSLIHYQTESLNTAYFVVGTTKRLEEEEVIRREGGLLGLGRTKKLHSDLAIERFAKIDIREQRTFPVHAEKLELVTSHPSHTYTIERDEDTDTLNLVIADPESFWKSSKYLVMVTE